MLAAVLGKRFCFELFVFGGILLRIAHGAVDLLAADRHPRLMRHGQLHHAQTVEFIGQPFPLVRRVARRQKEHALHLSAVQRGAGERDVAAMNGVKAAAHQSDFRHAAPLPSLFRRMMIDYTKFRARGKEESAYILKKAQNLKPSPCVDGGGFRYDEPF